jgi:hypothetical protein
MLQPLHPTCISIACGCVENWEGSGEGAVSTAPDFNAQPDSSTRAKNKTRMLGHTQMLRISGGEYHKLMTNGTVRPPSARAACRLLLCLHKQPHVANCLVQHAIIVDSKLDLLKKKRILFCTCQQLVTFAQNVCFLSKPVPFDFGITFFSLKHRGKYKYKWAYLRFPGAGHSSITIICG